MTSLRHPFSGRNTRSVPEETRRADPLPHLLRQLLARAGGPCLVTRTASRPWASALFQGRRHEVALRIEGADAAARMAAMIDGLADAPFALRGHFVADITADAQALTHEPDGTPVATIDLSALTIEEW